MIIDEINPKMSSELFSFQYELPPLFEKFLNKPPIYTFRKKMHFLLKNFYKNVGITKKTPKGVLIFYIFLIIIYCLLKALQLVNLRDYLVFQGGSSLRLLHRYLQMFLFLQDVYHS